MSNQKYLLGTDERQAWIRNYHFAPRGNGFKKQENVAAIIKNFNILTLGFGLYLWIAKMKKDIPVITKKIDRFVLKQWLDMYWLFMLR